MSDKFKNSKFYKTMKNPKVSRAIYISLVLLLVSVAVIAGITASANRNKKQPPASNDGTAVKPPVTAAPNVTTPESPSDTNAPDTNANGGKPSEPTVGKLPDFSLPVSGNLISYHDPELQVFSPTMNDYRVHLGVDIATSADSPVYSAAAGTVSKIWKDPMMGYCIAVSHSGDAVTVYKNLGKVLPDGIAEGVSVKAGQQIASVGESALTEVAEEPHLHFEMTVGGILVDPLEYYSADELEALAVDTAYEG